MRLPVLHRVLVLALFCAPMLALFVAPHAVSVRAAGGPARLVKDVNTSNGNDDAETSAFTNVGGLLFFIANDGANGRELWRSNGTDAGTYVVTDIAPGPRSTHFGTLVAVGNTLFFNVFFGDEEQPATLYTELWKSDGSPVGTTRFTRYNGCGDLAAVGATLFFGAADASGVCTLWKSDGSPAGTVRVTDTRLSTNTDGLAAMTAVGSTLFFNADDGTSGRELWKSDGTAAGTTRVADIWSGPNGANPHDLTAAGATLFFVANDGIHSDRLWKSNGTAAGTVQVADVTPFIDFTTQPVAVGNTLFFVIEEDESHRAELWKSDGTAAGTVQVKQIASGSPPFEGAPPYSSLPENLTNVNGTLFFTADDHIRGRELWKSDGTATGTVLVKDITTGSDSSDFRRFSFTVVNNTLFFALQTYVNGSTDIRLWKSDGTTAGTTQVTNQIGIPLNYDTFCAVGGTLFFVGAATFYQTELWKSDGTAAGTVRVAELRKPGSAPRNLTALGNAIYFAADDDETNQRLWRSDGTGAGTQLVTDAPVDDSDPDNRRMAAVGGTLIFTWQYDDDGRELWKSNGTATGTVPVNELTSVFNPKPGHFTNVGGKLFFTTNSFIEYGLWVTDGNDGGTKQLSTSPSSELTAFGSTLFFLVNEQELWKSDGTQSGTVKVADAPPNLFITDLHVAGSSLFFTVTNAESAFELWKSDGTTAGTQRIFSTATLPNKPSFGHLTGVGAQLFFTTETSRTLDLWKSDGSAAGTTRVRALPFVGDVWDQGPFIAVGSTLFFTADDGTSGAELWKSDGTAVGTLRVKDINPGPAGSAPTALTNINGTLLFSAYDAAHGYELWRSDGSEAGTALLQDINAGFANSNPQGFTLAGDQVFFQAATAEAGAELWALPVAALAAPAFTPNVSAGAGGTLQSPDGKVSLSFPAGAAGDDLAVTFTAITTPTHALGDGRRAVRSFALNATDRSGAPVTRFAKPYTLTISYDDAQLGAAGVTEATLNLVYWDGAAWVNILPCAGCSVDTAGNRITVQLDHFTDFAIAGSTQRTLYLPLTTR